MHPIQQSINAKFDITPSAPAPLALTGHMLHRAAMPLGVLITNFGDRVVWCSPLVLVVEARWVEQLGILHFAWEAYSAAGAAGFQHFKKLTRREHDIQATLPRQLDELLDLWCTAHPKKTCTFVYDYNEAVVRAIRDAEVWRGLLVDVLSKEFTSAFTAAEFATELYESVKVFAEEK